MSVVGSMDAIAVKAETMAGLKRCYSATGGGVSSTIRPIPQSIDDGPVGVVWIGNAVMAGGNSEALVIDMRLDIWVRATNAGWAYKTLAAYPDLARTAFRSDMNLGGECTRCMIAGWDEPEQELSNGQAYLVLPLRLEVLIERLAADATA
jgi:hypothetical protein